MPTWPKKKKKQFEAGEKKLPEYYFFVSPKKGLHQKLQPIFMKMTIVW